MGAHLVHEHQPPVVERTNRRAPNQPQPLVPFARSCRSFFRLCPRRLIARQIVASLTSTLQATKRNSLLCPWVTHGRASRSSSSSRMALSFSFGGEPREPSFRSKRVLLIEPLEVALNSRAVDAEPTGGLALGDTPSDGLHYLFAQVYGIRLHAPMMPAGATSSRDAVE